MKTSAPALDTSGKAVSALCSLWQWVRAESEHFGGPMPDDFIVELVEDAMNAAKTTSKRVKKLRRERETIGLKRRELYAHDDAALLRQILSAIDAGESLDHFESVIAPLIRARF